MSADEVGILARKHGCSTFRTIESTHDGGDHALNKGSTVFWFWFSSGRLVSYQEGRYFGTTGLRMSVRQNLCTGQMAASVMLEIVAPEDLAGATVYIDGVKTLGLSYGPVVMERIDGLRSGRHEIRIEKPGYKAILTHYDYTPKEFWPTDNEVRMVINQRDVSR